MAPRPRNHQTHSNLALLFFLAVSSTAVAYPLARRDAGIYTVQAPLSLHAPNTNTQQGVKEQEVPTYVRLDDVTDTSGDYEVVPVWQQGPEPEEDVDIHGLPTSADRMGIPDAWRVGGLGGAVRAVVTEMRDWRESLGRKFWPSGNGEGNVIGGRMISGLWMPW